MSGREQLILDSFIAALKKEDPSRLDDITQAVLYPTRLYSEEEKRIWQQIISDFSLGDPSSSTGAEFALNVPSELSEYEGAVEMGKPDPGDILGLSQNVDYSYHNPLFKTQAQLDSDQEGPHFSLYHAVELNPRLRLFANQFSPLSLIRPMPTRAFNAPAISSVSKIKSAAQYQDAAIHDSKMRLLTDAENKILEEKNALALKQRYEVQIMKTSIARGEASEVDVSRLEKTHEAAMKTFDDRLKKLQAQRQQGLAGVSNDEFAKETDQAVRNRADFVDLLKAAFASQKGEPVADSAPAPLTNLPSVSATSSSSSSSVTDESLVSAEDTVVDEAAAAEGPDSVATLPLRLRDATPQSKKPQSLAATLKRLQQRPGLTLTDLETTGYTQGRSFSRSRSARDLYALTTSVDGTLQTPTRPVAERPVSSASSNALTVLNTVQETSSADKQRDRSLVSFQQNASTLAQNEQRQQAATERLVRRLQPAATRPVARSAGPISRGGVLISPNDSLLSGASPLDISQASMGSINTSAASSIRGTSPSPQPGSVPRDSTLRRQLRQQFVEGKEWEQRIAAQNESQEKWQANLDRDFPPFPYTTLSPFPSNNSSPAARAPAVDQVFTTTPLRSAFSQPPSAPPSPGVPYFVRSNPPKRNVEGKELIPRLGGVSTVNFEREWETKVNQAASSRDLWELLRGLFDPATSPLYFYRELPRNLSTLSDDENFGGSYTLLESLELAKVKDIVQEFFTWEKGKTPEEFETNILDFLLLFKSYYNQGEYEPTQIPEWLWHIYKMVQMYLLWFFVKVKTAFNAIGEGGNIAMRRDEALNVIKALKAGPFTDFWTDDELWDAVMERWASQGGSGMTGGALSANDYKKKKKRKKRGGGDGKAAADAADGASSKRVRMDPDQAGADADVKVDTAAAADAALGDMPPPLPRWTAARRKREMKVSRKPPSDKKDRAWDNKLRAIAALQTPDQPIWRTERTKKTTYKGPGRSKIYKVNTKTTVVSRNKKQVYDCTRVRKGGRTKHVGACRPVITDHPDGARFQQEF